MIQRYDLEVGVEGLDWESVHGLICLQMIWSARANLRARWMLRNLLWGHGQLR